MTIDNAIKILEFITWSQQVALGERPMEAVRLGLEALKAIKASRPTGIHPGMHKLPGETEE